MVCRSAAVFDPAGVELVCRAAVAKCGNQAAHEFVFRLPQPLAVKPGDVLHIEIDSGGSSEFDTLARFRISLPVQNTAAADGTDKQ